MVARTVGAAMAREVKLNQLDAVLEEFDYPCDRETVVERGRDVTLVLAEGTENLGELVAASNDGTFESAEDLSTEVMNLLPQHAVGEPYQSEGEG